MAAEYVFIDEWDVGAPQEAVFEALADAADGLERLRQRLAGDQLRRRGAPIPQKRVRPQRRFELVQALV